MTAETPGATRPVPPPVGPEDPRLEAVAQLLSIIDALRAPDGCPWDREQTEASMTPHLVEEAHELIEAIEIGTVEQSASEAGDCLVSLLMVCRIAEDSGRYDVGGAARAAAEKLVRRHPHVFADADAKTSAAVLTSWEETKRAERAAAGEDTSALAGVPTALPALQRAGRVCQKAVAAGFHWKDARGALGKLEEELDELRAELPIEVLAESERPTLPPEVRQRVEDELGDVLMAAAFLGGYLGLEPETLTRRAIRRFETRFRHMEAQLDGTLAGRDLDTMMAAWKRAKTATD